MPRDLQPGEDEVGAPPLTWWQRAWTWLEGHVPDVDADLGTDDEEAPA